MMDRLPWGGGRRRGIPVFNHGIERRQGAWSSVVVKALRY